MTIKIYQRFMGIKAHRIRRSSQHSFADERTTKSDQNKKRVFNLRSIHYAYVECFSIILDTYHSC
jgi:hypothetical protein